MSHYVVIKMMMKILFLCSVLSLVGCGLKSRKSMEITVLVYPYVTRSESYKVTVTNDALIRTEAGVRNNDSEIWQFSKVHTVDEKWLSSSEFDLVEKFCSLFCESSIPDDPYFNEHAWFIFVKCEGCDQVLVSDLNLLPSGLKEKLLKIFEMSPVEIDMHGWS